MLPVSTYLRTYMPPKHVLALACVTSIVLPILSKAYLTYRLSPNKQTAISFLSTFSLLQFYSPASVVNFVFAAVMCGAGGVFSAYVISPKKEAGPAAPVSQTPSASQSLRYLMDDEIQELLPSPSNEVRYRALNAQDKVEVLRRFHSELIGRVKADPVYIPLLRGCSQCELSISKEGDDIKIEDRKKIWMIRISQDGRYTYENEGVIIDSQRNVYRAKDGYIVQNAAKQQILFKCVDWTSRKNGDFC